MKLQQKLAILADAAKYDASCASSGSTSKNSRKGKGVGSTSSGMGICHSYTPDGRCVSLLKILLTNFCIYECSYCINRASSPVERARFTVDEVVNLTIDFYKRNYIEGLFLSSGIIQSSDYTMEQLVSVARELRKTHDFRGYIHLKTIPDASPELLRMAGLYADRLSINVELPSKQSLALYAPEKNPVTIKQSMGTLRDHIDESKESRKKSKIITSAPHRKRKPSSQFMYSPAGQSTQMIVGADQSSDAKILTLANNLYGKYHMRRVYYSAFSPIPHAAHQLPAQSPPLLREHRLYQADWLLRFYGFDVSEIASTGASANDGMLDLDVDPKLAWALRNRHIFPVNINTAPREMLLRVPGIGAIGAHKIIQSRRFKKLRIADIAKCGLSIKKIEPFIEAADNNSASHLLEDDNLKQYFMKKESAQMALF
ncbi:putative DNA modification/repair radical SAM protein [Eionea flava]